MYAFTADGLSMRQLRDYVEGVRSAVLRVPNIGKTMLVGTQDESIYLDFSTGKLAGLGIDTAALIKTLQAQKRHRAIGRGAGPAPSRCPCGSAASSPPRRA